MQTLEADPTPNPEVPLLDSFPEGTGAHVGALPKCHRCSVLQKAHGGVFACFGFRATPAAHGGSQARGRIGATAAGLHHSQSNAGSEPRLRPTPQRTATQDP